MANKKQNKVAEEKGIYNRSKGKNYTSSKIMVINLTQEDQKHILRTSLSARRPMKLQVESPPP